MFLLAIVRYLKEVFVNSDSGLRRLFASALHAPNRQYHSSTLRLDHGNRHLCVTDLLIPRSPDACARLILKPP